jgi:nucleoside-diphosphate-sugar epimerase
MDGKRILVTGPTGQVATPLVRSLAASNEVIGIARFRDPAARAALEAQGVRCIEVNLASGEFGAVPDDVDIVLNLAVVKSGRWEVDLKGNAEAAGLLMAHCRGAEAFVHVSSTGVYQHAGAQLLAEDAPLGDNHRGMMPTYSIAKIAAEAVVRTEARQLGLPTTIARINVPYGDGGGWPAFHLEMLLAGMAVEVHPDRPNLFNPIHDDDLFAFVPGLVAAASVPATIVNLGGDQQVALEDWVRELGQLTGRTPRFVENPSAIGGITTDNTRRLELLGPTRVDWHDGFRRMVANLHPEALVAT